MLTHEMKKTTFGKASRSGFHYIITPAPLFKHIAETRFDAAGGMIVIGLSGGMVILMRLLVAN